MMTFEGNILNSMQAALAQQIFSSLGRTLLVITKLRVWLRPPPKFLVKGARGWAKIL